MQELENNSQQNGYQIEVANATLDFNVVSISDATPTGRQLALAAGLRNTDGVIILQLLSDGQMEDIRMDEVVDLKTTSRKFMMERSDRTYNMSVDGTRLSWPCRFISGAAIRKLGGVDTHFDLFQELEDTPDKRLNATDLVDLDGDGVESFKSRLPSWQLDVQGVVISSKQPTILVRDALVKANFDVTQGWQIFLKVADKPKQQVELDTIIDLSTPGIEKLRLSPKSVNNGEVAASGRRDFTLLDADEDYLDAAFLRWETIVDGGRRWLVIEEFGVPDGYTAQRTKLALEIPETYPGAQIDMFYVYPPLALQTGREIGCTQVRAVIQGIEFHGWSRHRGPGSEWKIGVDNVITHMALVESAIQKETE